MKTRGQGQACVCNYSLLYSFLLYLFILCVRGVCAHASHRGSLEVRADSIYFVVLVIKQVIKLGNKCLHALKPLTSLLPYFLRQGCS